MKRPKGISDYDWENKLSAIRSNIKRAKYATAKKKKAVAKKKRKELQRKMMDGTQDVVYVIGWSEGGPMKVGITDKIDKRIAQLQTGNPYKLKVFHTVPCDTRSESSEIESWTHARLGGFRLHGEWFDIGAIECINSIRVVADAVKLRGS